MSDIPTPAECRELLELAEKATPGPWYTVDLPWRRDDLGTYVIAGHFDPHLGKPVCDSIEITEWDAEDDGPDYSQSDRDLSFIAAARDAIPRLARAVIVLLERCEAAENNARIKGKAYERLMERARLKGLDTAEIHLFAQGAADDIPGD